MFGYMKGKDRRKSVNKAKDNRIKTLCWAGRADRERLMDRFHDYVKIKIH